MAGNGREKNVWFNTGLLFVVLQNRNSSYYNWEPFCDIGFGAGF